MAVAASVWAVSRVLRSRSKQLTNFLFGRHLLLTNLGISVSLSATGDILQQHYDIFKHNQIEWDKNRTRDMAASGFTVGLVCHYWYVWLDRLIPGRSLKIVCQKLVLDQLLLSPFYISVFFVTVGALERSSWAEIKEEIREKGMRIYTAEWYIWPPAQIFNFAFLPTRFRVLYDNTISLGFDVYTSYVKHGNPGEKSSDPTSPNTAQAQTNVPKNSETAK